MYTCFLYGCWEWFSKFCYTVDMDYISIIDKYFQNNERGRAIYLIHVTLVTKKALQLARKQGLSDESLTFIEEAGMLHDIGCCMVDMPAMGFETGLPYLKHMTEGHRILEEEGLPKHARVASTHTGVGITAQEIRERGLPLDERDYIPETIEERIISYADLFFSKNPEKLFYEKTPEEVRSMLANLSDEQVAIFNKWHKEFTK